MSHTRVKVCTQMWQQITSYAVLKYQLLGCDTATWVDSNAKASLSPGPKSYSYILVDTVKISSEYNGSLFSVSEPLTAP